jgi:hypothetical protein
MVTNRDRKSLDSAEKIPNFAQTNSTVDVFDPLSGILGTTSRRASSWMMDPTSSRDKPSYLFIPSPGVF